MSVNSGRYSFVQFMNYLCFFFGFIGEVLRGQSNANNKENKKRNYYNSQIYTVEQDQDYTHVSEHQTRQISYTSNQFTKLAKPSTLQNLTTP